MKKLYVLFKTFLNQITKYHISAYASSAAFFMFLSLIPMLLLICAILPYTPVSEADLMEAMAQILPQNLVPIAISTVSDIFDKSPAILSVSALFTVWSSGKGMLAVIRGLNTIHHTVSPGNYFLQRIRASIYTVLFVFLILFSLVVGVFGESILIILGNKFSELTIFYSFLSHIKILVIFVLLCLFFLLLFTYIPNTKLYWKTQIVGAVFVAVAWSGFSYAFSVYVKYFAGDNVYGNMTTIVILMLWFYVGFYLLFLGALLSKFLMPATEFLIDRIEMKKE